MKILHSRTAVFALDVLVHHTAAEGTGTVHGEHCNDVLETVYSQFSEELAHSVRFKLEDPQRVCFLQYLVGLLVVERDLLHIRKWFPAKSDVLQCFLYDGERPKSKEVHLDESEPLDRLHGELRDDLNLTDPTHRDEVRHRHRGDNYTSGVLRTVAGKPFDFRGDVKHALRHRIALLHLGKLGDLFERLAD